MDNLPKECERCDFKLDVNSWVPVNTSPGLAKFTQPIVLKCKCERCSHETKALSGK